MRNVGCSFAVACRVTFVPFDLCARSGGCGSCNATLGEVTFKGRAIMGVWDGLEDRGNGWEVARTLGYRQFDVGGW